MISAVEDLARLLSAGNVVVVSGAGLSTTAGLPDYRGNGGGETPSVTYDMFVSNPMWQRWVWQRNQETWRALDALAPTRGHLLLSSWERDGIITGTATQNVDGLHAKAGSVRVAEMHGSFTRVACIDCGEITSRRELDSRLRALNPYTVDDPQPGHAAVLAEADSGAAAASTFIVAPCATCGGTLKPDIVFFGETVQALDEAFEFADDAKTILVLGSSLLVMTGMWVVSRGLSSGAALAIVNAGPTQADRLADLRIDTPIDAVLAEADALLRGE
ncbi:Sir2 family NAD-dependent protein deacetylase [Flaviflexus equikiangi]|uniref:protein acetyllysine N-acetyltransferase n=1 Tax=Flaviflexus equikiangi TaxID=2758573 RepID=A0ABS2TH17_9ACTO|nr:Sir2 family NAD-dependent protein deacetylase [Flaviflexus equikiangi]MBM9433936.1 NAD-dependent deacetylase [Flaviflexus equikiangi]